MLAHKSLFKNKNKFTVSHLLSLLTTIDHHLGFAQQKNGDILSASFFNENFFLNLTAPEAGFKIWPKICFNLRSPNFCLFKFTVSKASVSF